MIKNKQKPLGLSDELPEGIFGLMDAAPSPRPVRKKKTTGRDSRLDAASKPKLRKVVPTKVGKRRHVPPMSSDRVMPEFAINYGKALPSEANGLTLDNVVSIPEQLLKRITDRTQLNARKLSDIMLLNAAASVLSFDAASSYVRAVLDDGLGIEVDVDRGVLDVVKELARLDVVFFYVKRLSLPQALKRRFMHTFTDDLAKHSLTTMNKTNKSEQFSQQLRELEGVLVKRSEGGRKTRSAGKDVDDKIQEYMQNRAERSAGPSGSVGVKRGRSSSPIAGF